MFYSWINLIGKLPKFLTEKTVHEKCLGFMDWEEKAIRK
jgi:hypothetical protein